MAGIFSKFGFVDPALVEQKQRIEVSKSQERRAGLEEAISGQKRAKLMQQQETGRAMVLSFGIDFKALRELGLPKPEFIERYKELKTRHLMEDSEAFIKYLTPITKEWERDAEYQQVEASILNSKAARATYRIRHPNVRMVLTPSGVPDPGSMAAVAKWDEDNSLGTEFPTQLITTDQGSYTEVDMAAIRTQNTASAQRTLEKKGEEMALLKRYQEQGIIEGRRLEDAKVDWNIPIEAVVASVSSDHRMVQGTKERYSKFSLIEQSLGELETALEGTAVGPATAAIEKFKKFFIGDSSHMEINARINGLVPNVARAVFGEVGVLTDNDIRNYKQILADPSLSGQANAMLIAMLKRGVARAALKLLHTEARDGINVSRFSDDTRKWQSQLDAWDDKQEQAIPRFRSPAEVLKSDLQPGIRIEVWDKESGKFRVGETTPLNDPVTTPRSYPVTTP